MQHNKLCAWILVDDSIETRATKFVAIETGQEVAADLSNMDYISTTQIGDYVFHWFTDKI